MVAHFNDHDFAVEVLSSSLPVLVDFYADWCGPCKMMAPVVEQLAEEYAGRIKVGKINVDESSAVARQYGIMSIPTLLFIKNGQVVDQVVGALPKSILETKLKAVLA